MAATESTSAKSTNGNKAPAASPMNPIELLVHLDHIKVDNSVNARGFNRAGAVEDDDAFKSLAANIREHGLLNPITVMTLPTPEGDHKYVVVAGFRRIAACKAAGINPVRCTVVQGDAIKAQEMNLAENMARGDLNAAEQAFGLLALKRHAEAAGRKLTNESIAIKVGQSKSNVGNLIRTAEKLIPEAADYWKGTKKGVAFRLSNEEAFRFAGMDPEKQKDALTAWLDVKKEGVEAKAENATETTEADPNKPAKMPRRDKIETYYLAIKSGRGVEKLLIGSGYVDFADVSTETKSALKSLCKWLVAGGKDPAKMEEEEEEASE